MNPRWLFQDGWSNGVIGNIQWYHLAEQAPSSLFNEIIYLAMPKQNKNIREEIHPPISVVPQNVRGLIYKARPPDIHHDRLYDSVVLCQ